MHKRTSINSTLLFVCVSLIYGLLAVSCGHNEPEENLTCSAVLSPEGGVYKLENGVTLVVPQGAVNTNTEVEINYSDNVAQLGNEAKLSTDIYGMITCSPEGLVFERPIEVHIPTTMPASDTTAIFLWDSQETAWTLTDFGLTEGNKIVFTVEHFSHYVAIPQEYLTLFDIFDRFIDIYVKNGETSSAELNTACDRFCKEYLDEKLHLGDIKVSETYENGNPRQTCIGICGYFVHVIGQEEGGTIYQGTGRYGTESNDGVIYNMTDRMLSEHWKNNKKDYSHQARARIINLYAKPVEIDLAADAESHSITKGKTTNVTIHTSCDGSVLPQQTVTLETNGIVQVEKSEVKTNNDGTVTVSVMGKKEGTGIIKIKTISPADPTLVSETEVTITVSNQPSSGNRYHADIEEEMQIFLEDLHQYAENNGKFAIVVIKSEMDYEYDKYGLNVTVTNAKITDVSVKQLPAMDTIIQVSQQTTETYTSHTEFSAETPISLSYSTESYIPQLTEEKKLMTMTRKIMSRYHGDDGYNTIDKIFTWKVSVDFTIWQAYNIQDMDIEGTHVIERQYFSDPYIGLLGQNIKMTGDITGTYLNMYNGNELENKSFNQTPNLYGTMNIKSTVTIRKN